MATHKQFAECKDQVIALVEAGVGDISFITQRLGKGLPLAVIKNLVKGGKLTRTGNKLALA